MKLEQSPLIFLDKAPGRGLGVFAKEPIIKGQTVEVVPVLFIRGDELADIEDGNIAENYIYYWEEDLYAIALGYGSLYNHSYEPNAVYDFGEKTLIYRALRDIPVGEEVTINYNLDPEDKTPLHFEVK